MHRRSSRSWPQRALGATCGLLLGALVLLAWCPPAAAQSVEVGFGFGVALQTFVEDDADHEFRVTPAAGNYPTLEEIETAAGSFHLHIALVLDGLDVLFFDDLEIRFDFGSFGWSQSTVTHTSCTPVELVDGSYDPAVAEFQPLEEVDCLPEGYDATTEVGELDLPELQTFLLGVGGRWRALDMAGWTIWLGLTPSFVISTFADPGAEFFLGGSIAGSAGVNFRVSDILTLKLFESRATFMMTEAPDDIQNRLNHDTSPCPGGGDCSWIGSSLIETFFWLDFQIGLAVAF